MIPRIMACMSFVLCSGFCLCQTVNKHIHVDQFGYRTTSPKVAVLSDPQSGYNASDIYTPSTTIHVKDAVSGATIYQGSVVQWQNGATQSSSGDRGWWFDFSAVTTPGTYYLEDQNDLSRSYDFEIGDAVYEEVLEAASKMYYYNRCNYPKAAPYADAKWIDGDNFNNPGQDYSCRFIDDPTNASLERDLSGGWFDAGDYNKYVTFTQRAMHHLLYAYQESPDAFSDATNIPESGNGIADILDEVNYELAWLEKMTNADGSVINKIGSPNYATNVNSPPSTNTDPRFYGPTCTSASITAAGIYAHAALVYRDIPALATYADTLQQLAITCFDYVLPFINSGTLETDCDDGSIVAGDADRTVAQQREEALTAAIYLMQLTDDIVYKNYIIANINDAPPVNANWFDTNSMIVLEPLLEYRTLAGADAATVAEIDASITPLIQGNWNGFFGFDDIDLYRAYCPDWAYNWGSTQAIAEYGILNRVLAKYDYNPSQTSSYQQKAAQQLHYFHGINPLNIVYLSNMYEYGGDHCVNQIYHTWFNEGTIYDHALNSPNGPAPGFVTGGPNQNYPYTGLVPPYGQPLQKSYADFNDGGNIKVPWQITEPAIYYQSAYVRLLAAYYDEPCHEVTTVYVDQSVPQSGDGSSWSAAFASLDDALANPCISTIDTIKIAAGVYIPTTADRSYSWPLPNASVIDGGYAPGGNSYDPAIYQTILSGDIGTVDSSDDNLFHVIQLPEQRILTLRGLAITYGNADGTGEDGRGGGILNQGALYLHRVTITGNQSTSGDQVCNVNSGSLVVSGTCDID